MSQRLEVVGPRLQSLLAEHEVVGEVRGSGVFWAVELVEDRETRAPITAALVGRLKGNLMSRGMPPFFAYNRIHVVPRV